jgi:hypothetical protein
MGRIADSRVSNERWDRSLYMTSNNSSLLHDYLCIHS